MNGEGTGLFFVSKHTKAKSKFLAQQGTSPLFQLEQHVAPKYQRPHLTVFLLMSFKIREDTGQVAAGEKR